MLLGFFLFVLILLMAFWMMFFLASFLPFWIFAYVKDLFYTPSEDQASE
jgi:hypothetical protein